MSKYFKINYTAFITKVVQADDEEKAYEAFGDNVDFGDLDRDTGTCDEITDPVQRESSIRHNGLIKAEE